MIYSKVSPIQRRISCKKKTEMRRPIKRENNFRIENKEEDLSQQRHGIQIEFSKRSHEKHRSIEKNTRDIC